MNKLVELFNQNKNKFKTYEIGTSFFQGRPWSCYLEGYREAYNLISKDIISKIESEQFINRNIFLPIFYLCRHFLELTFKEICINCDNQFGEQNKYDNHDLKSLFEKFKLKALRAYNEPYKSNQHNDIPFDDEEILKIEEVVLHFDSFDKGSFTFRYPTDLRGNQVWPLSENIDFLCFYKRMNIIEDILIRISVDTMYEETQYNK